MFQFPMTAFHVILVPLIITPIIVICLVVGMQINEGVAVLLAVVGFFVSLPVAFHLTNQLLIRWIRADIKSKETDQLRLAICTQRPPFNHWIHMFLELRNRGETNFEKEWPTVLNLLSSDDEQQRLNGGIILLAFYPEIRARVPEYDPRESAETCRTKLSSGEIKTAPFGAASNK